MNVKKEKDKKDRKECVKGRKYQNNHREKKQKRKGEKFMKMQVLSKDESEGND